MLLLVHEPGHGRVTPVQSLAAGRHRVADINAALGVFLDPDVPQVVGLLEVDGVLVTAPLRKEVLSGLPDLLPRTRNVPLIRFHEKS
jgi:hypothetical protein